jgi:DGQHR domain-containing protein
MQVQVTRFMQRQNKEGKELFLGVLSAEELVRVAEIDFFKPETKDGYQRTLVNKRVRDLAAYVSKQGGLLPTAVLVNVRSDANFIPWSDNGLDGNIGWLSIPDSETLWVVDGQHRVEGLRKAVDNSSEPLLYDVPVVFSFGLDRDQETDLFYVVNTQARSVPTDLTAEIIARRTFDKLKERRAAIERGDEQTADELTVKPTDLRKSLGVVVAHGLNAHQGGPWFDKIRTGNEAKDPTRPMRLNTFASTLRPFLEDRWVKRQYEGTGDSDRIYVIVQAYWEALSRLMPEAFADIENYAVQHPLGVYVFHELLPDIVGRIQIEDDWSPESFQSHLDKLDRWVQSGTWHLKHAQPIIRANNRATIKYILEQMAPLLNRIPERV